MPFLDLTLLLLALAIIGWLGWSWWQGRAPEDDRARLGRLGETEGAEELEAEIEDSQPRFVRAVAGAGISWPPFVVGIAFAALGVFTFFAIYLTLGRLWLLALLISGLIVYSVWVLLREFARFRSRRFERHLIDAVDHIVSALLAGENPTRALATSAGAAPRAVRIELDEAVHRLGLGMNIRQALSRMVARYDSEGVRLFTQTLTVKWQTGGDLAPVLKTVAWIMRERLRLNMRLRTELTGVQLAGVLLALLPYVVLPIFLLIRPSWPATVLGHPNGPMLLVSAIVLQIVGLVWLRSILKIEF